MASPPPERSDDEPAPAARAVPQFKSFSVAAPSNPVPRFGSFKPTPSSASASASSKHAHSESRSGHHDGSSSSRRTNRDRSSDRHAHRGYKDDDSHSRHRRDRSAERRHHHHRHRHHKRRHSRSRSRSRQRSRSRSPRRKRTEKEDVVTLRTTAHQDPTILPWDVPQLPYQVDTKGDPHNITYGTIHRYNIPQYWRSGKGRVVGLGRSVKIQADKGDGKGLVIGKAGGGKGDGRVRGWSYAAEESRQLRIKAAEEADVGGFVEGWNFVEFPGAAARKRRKEAERTAGEHGELGGITAERDYRSIEGMQKPTAGGDVDEDLEEVGSSDDGAGTGPFDSEVKERTVRLSRLVDAEPHNIDAWFALMEHQETIVYGSKERRRRKVRQGERHGLEEVKLGVLEKAISKNEGNPRLLLAYMGIATGIWEPPKVKAKWEDLLSRHATAIDLWEAYINFRQTDFNSFKYRECLGVYEECIGRLRGRILRYAAGEDEKAKLEEILLYILTRATVYMQQAGFSELSLAIWQGILELNSSPPGAFTVGPKSLTDHERMLDALGAFWDSEVLRIGEPKAKGWAAYADEDLGEFADPKDLPEDYDPSGGDGLQLDDPDFFGAWLDKEKVLLGKLPARTTDEIEEDDPFRVILFTDIRELLWKFQTPAAKAKVGDAFLAFTGLVAPTAYQNDGFFRADLVTASHSGLAKWFWGDVDGSDAKLITWIDGMPMETERRGRVGRNPFLFKSGHVPMSPDYVLRIPDERLALVYLAVEYSWKPSNNKKVAKQLLKRHSNSLKLWNAFAMSEMIQGNKDSAKGVYQTALKMSAVFSGDQQRAALDLLLAIPDGYTAVGKATERGPTAILKTRRFLEEQQHRMYSQQEFEATLAYAELQSLLLYLSVDDSAPTVFLRPLDDVTGDLQDRCEGGIGERLLMMHYHHSVRARPYKAAIFRVFLDDAIAKFPDNTAFLSLFVWNESRSKIEHRIRKMLMPADEATAKEGGAGGDSVVKWVFAIWAELQMGAGRSVNPNGIRNLFEKAVEPERTKSSVQLWLLYLRFELWQSQPGRAKGVFFRAVRACPWSKDVILSGFRWLRSTLDFGEMRKVYGVMQEKELRIHVDIEEMLEEWDKEGRMASAPAISGGVGHRITLPSDDDSEMEEHE
ncbi:hypothetical protein DRE_03486 [Drechslerella stenobrocha 248]|uniref:DUF1740-domain-containing protein n=1 Tax=Drechslerella stenobrocha 248 TaxID=1043628 RepID=W7I3Y8_9PEZI|nr:hypothetical protein DRE_03486 [Drechslerella stenobrocha 248]